MSAITYREIILRRLQFSLSFCFDMVYMTGNKGLSMTDIKIEMVSRDRVLECQCRI